MLWKTCLLLKEAVLGIPEVFAPLEAPYKSSPSKTTISRAFSGGDRPPKATKATPLSTCKLLGLAQSTNQTPKGSLHSLSIGMGVTLQTQDSMSRGQSSHWVYGQVPVTPRLCLYYRWFWKVSSHSFLFLASLCIPRG